MTQAVKMNTVTTRAAPIIEATTIPAMAPLDKEVRDDESSGTIEPLEDKTDGNEEIEAVDKAGTAEDDDEETTGMSDLHEARTIALTTHLFSSTLTNCGGVVPSQIILIVISAL